MDRLRRWKDKYGYVLPPLFAVSFLIFYALDLFGSSLATGWDTAGHFYLFTQLHQSIVEGSWYSYDLNWFTGFPGLRLYSPFFYLVGILIWLLSGATLSLISAFNLSILATILVYFGSLLSFFWFVQPKKHTFLKSILAASLSLYGLVSYAEVRDIATGLLGILDLGLFAQNWGYAFFLGLIPTYYVLIKHPKNKWFVVAGLLATGLILSHIITTFFAVFFFGVMLLFDWPKWIKHWQKILVVGLGVLLATSWWWWPFLELYSYSSSERVETQLQASLLVYALEPLLANLKDFLFSGRVMVNFVHLVLVFSVLMICVQLLRQKLKLVSWQIATIVTTFLFGFGALYDLTPLSIHYYRVWPLLLILWYGWACQFWWNMRLRSLMLLSVLVAVAVLHHIWLIFIPRFGWGALEKVEWQSQVDTALEFVETDWKTRDKEYPPRLHSNLTGFENLTNALYYIESLAALRDIEVASGLLKESAFTSPYLQQTISNVPGRLIQNDVWLDYSTREPYTFEPFEDGSNWYNFVDAFEPNYFLSNQPAVIETFIGMLERYQLEYQKLDALDSIQILYLPESARIRQIDRPILVFRGSLTTLRYMFEIVAGYPAFGFDIIYDPTAQFDQPATVLTEQDVYGNELTLLSLLGDNVEGYQIPNSQSCDLSLTRLSQTELEVTGCGLVRVAYAYSPSLTTNVPVFITQPGHIILDLGDEPQTARLEYR